MEISEENDDKTVILTVEYLGQCGCGFKRKVTRKIELEETQTLDDLYYAIIRESFRWWDPHMYSFFFDNIPYSGNAKMEYCSDPEARDPFDTKEVNSTDIKLKELNLKKNQKFLFIFDFGDDHHFNIKVKGFGKAQKGKIYPLILEEEGSAPRQYPNYEK